MTPAFHPPLINPPFEISYWKWAVQLCDIHIPNENTQTKNLLTKLSCHVSICMFSGQGGQRPPLRVKINTRV